MFVRIDGGRTEVMDGRRGGMSNWNGRTMRCCDKEEAATLWEESFKPARFCKASYTATGPAIFSRSRR